MLGDIVGMKKEISTYMYFLAFPLVYLNCVHLVLVVLMVLMNSPLKKIESTV